MAKWKKNMTVEEKQEYAKIAKAKLDAAETMLKDGVKAVYNSTKWKEAMNYYASFHNYSLCNCLLIMMQKPEATRVASYADWKKKGRQVRKGETGITIRVPAPGKHNCVSLLIPKETLLAFLKDRGLTWEYYENESITQDFDGLYEFAKGKIALMKYSN